MCFYWGWRRWEGRSGCDCLHCSCGKGDSERFRDCPRAHSLEAVESDRLGSKPQPCPRGLPPPLRGDLSPRSPSKANTGLHPPPPPRAHPTPIALLETPRCGHLHRSVLRDCPHLRQVSLCRPFPTRIPQHFMLQPQLLCASHTLSRPLPPILFPLCPCGWPAGFLQRLRLPPLLQNAELGLPTPVGAIPEAVRLAAVLPGCHHRLGASG